MALLFLHEEGSPRPKLCMRRHWWTSGRLVVSSLYRSGQTFAEEEGGQTNSGPVLIPECGNLQTAEILLVYTVLYTPWKITMEPENHRFVETSLPKVNFLVPLVPC